jgi:hypothetical protein
VGADQDVHAAFPELGEDSLHLCRTAETGRHLDADGQVAITLTESVPVLLGENGRRSKQECLAAVRDCRERRPDGDFSLAEADVAADEPIHRPRCFEILLHRFDRALLVARLFIGEARLELLDELSVDVERDS